MIDYSFYIYTVEYLSRSFCCHPCVYVFLVFTSCFFCVEQCSYPSPCPRLTAEVKHASAQWMVMLNGLLFRERSWKWEATFSNGKILQRHARIIEKVGVPLSMQLTQRGHISWRTPSKCFTRGQTSSATKQKRIADCCLPRCLVKATQEVVSADNHIGS